MGPKTQEAERDAAPEISEITPEEFPEWHALAAEAMAEMAGDSDDVVAPYSCRSTVA